MIFNLLNLKTKETYTSCGRRIKLNKNSLKVSQCRYADNEQVHHRKINNQAKRKSLKRKFEYIRKGRATEVSYLGSKII